MRSMLDGLQQIHLSMIEQRSLAVRHVQCRIFTDHDRQIEDDRYASNAQDDHGQITMPSLVADGDASSFDSSVQRIGRRSIADDGHCIRWNGQIDVVVVVENEQGRVRKRLRHR